MFFGIKSILFYKMIPCLNNKMKGENQNVFTFISNGDNYETVKTGNCGR